MGIYFIWATLSIGVIAIAWLLSDIRIELRYRNTLAEKQIDILKKITKQ